LPWKNSPVHVHDDNALRRLPQAGYFAARALNDRSFH
jgi:hypothetical protein